MCHLGCRVSSTRRSASSARSRSPGGCRRRSSSAWPRSSTGAGFAYLEISGGGVFDNAVRRGVESPWERIRALKARTSTPLALAAPRPLPRRLAAGRRRFRPPLRRLAPRRAASTSSGSTTRSNDVDNLREAAEAIVGSRQRVRGRPALRQRPPRGARRGGEAPARARRRAASSCNDPGGAAAAASGRRAGRRSCASCPACRSASTRRAPAATHSPRRSRRRAPART